MYVYRIFVFRSLCEVSVVVFLLRGEIMRPKLLGFVVTRRMLAFFIICCLFDRLVG